MYHSFLIYWRRHWHPTPIFLPGKSQGRRSLVGCSPWGCKELYMTEQLHFHFHFHELEKEMATHSSILAWRIPGTEEPGGLPSMGSHRVGHDWSDLAAAAGAVLYWSLFCEYITVFLRTHSIFDELLAYFKLLVIINNIICIYFLRVNIKRLLHHMVIVHLTL